MTIRDPEQRSVVLTGFMGVGKSTVGRLLAEVMGRQFLDMDETIEAEEGRSVGEIFARQGEAYFRQMEADLVARIAHLPARVIASGGGTFLRWENHELFAANGTCIVSLSAPLAVIQTRLSCCTLRPLLGNKETIADLYAARLAVYRRIPRQVDTGGKTPRQVVREILSIIPGAGGLLSFQ